MRTTSKALLAITFTLLAVFTKAQPWMESVKTAQPTFQEIQKAFYEYWKDRPREKGKGYNVFKRWEAFWEQRLLPDGSFPDPSFNREELRKYRSAHPKKTTGKLTEANWTSKGPFTSTGGRAGLGRVNTIAFHPTNVNTFWVGTPAGGLWKTTDGGMNWASNTDNLGVLGISDIAIDPNNPTTMYIATGDGDGGDTYSIGILKSTDGGSTWTPTGLHLNASERRLVRRVIIHPNNSQILLAAASSGIWRTTDGGVTWTNIQPGNFYDIEFKPGDPATVYASGVSRVYLSTNSGVSWTAVFGSTDIRRINIAVTPAAPDRVYAIGVNVSGGLAGIWSSTNSGAAYTMTFTGTPPNNLLSWSDKAADPEGQGLYDLAFVVNPTNANDIWVGGINTWNSTDGGTTWTIKTYWRQMTTIPLVHADKHFLAFHPLATSTLFECNDGGLHKTTDRGATWIDLSNGLGISQINRISVSATVIDNVLVGLQDNSTKKMQGGTWTETNQTGDGFECIIDYTNPAIMYVAEYTGNIYKSIDGGVTWTSFVRNGGSGVHEMGPWVTPYVMHPTNNTTLLVGKSQVYQTTDGGATWTQLGTLPATGANVSAIAYAPSDPQTIYVATEAKFLYKTTDGGSAWTQIGTSTQTIQSIAVHATNPQKLWFVQSGYIAGNKVWASADGGATWTNVSGTLPNVPANCIVYEKGSNDGVYIGTDVGVFYRDATLTDWETYQRGLPNVIVTELEIAYTNNKLWAATYGRGLWNTDLRSSCTIPAAPSSSGDPIVCQDATPAILTATPPAGSTVDWYSAPTGGTLLQRGSTTYRVSAAGTYYAESRSTTGDCSSPTRTPVSVIINPIPAQPTITQNGATLQSSASSGNQWYFNNVVITANGNRQTYTPTATGQYSVVTTVNGCPSLASVPFSFTNTAIHSLELDNNIVIAPNPVTNNLLITYKGNAARFQALLLDISGKQVLEQGYFTTTYSLDMHRYSAGPYLIRITNEHSKEHVQRVIMKK